MAFLMRIAVFFLTPFFIASIVFAASGTVIDLDAKIQAAQVQADVMRAAIGALPPNLRGPLYNELNTLIKNGGLSQAQGIAEASRLFASLRTQADVDAFSAKLSELRTTYNNQRVENARIEGMLDDPKGTLTTTERTRLRTEQLEPLHQSLRANQVQIEAMDRMYRDLANDNANLRNTASRALSGADTALANFNDRVRALNEKINLTKLPCQKPILRFDKPANVLNSQPENIPASLPAKLSPLERPANSFGNTGPVQNLGNGARPSSPKTLPGAGSIGKTMGRGTNIIGYLPPFSEIINVFTGVTDQDYIDLYRSYVKGSQNRIVIIDRQMARLAAQISAIVPRQRGDMQGDGRRVLQSQLDALRKERDFLEEKIQWWEGRMIIKAFNIEEEKMNSGDRRAILNIEI